MSPPSPRLAAEPFCHRVIDLLPSSTSFVVVKCPIIVSAPLLIIGSHWAASSRQIVPTSSRRGSSRYKWRLLNSCILLLMPSAETGLRVVAPLALGTGSALCHLQSLTFVSTSLNSGSVWHSA